MFDKYKTEGIFDEMMDANGKCRPHYKSFKENLEILGKKKLQQLQHSTDKAQMSMGMTFNVYHDNQGLEKILHLDLVPRIISGSEWTQIENGLKQRIEALNLFIDDLYHKQKILKDGIVPKELILSSKDFLHACQGLNPPKGIWCHITGTDIVRDINGTFMVLEDNLRCDAL